MLANQVLRWWHHCGHRRHHYYEHKESLLFNFWWPSALKMGHKNLKSRRQLNVSTVERFYTYNKNSHATVGLTQNVVTECGHRDRDCCSALMCWHTHRRAHTYVHAYTFTLTLRDSSHKNKNPVIIYILSSSYHSTPDFFFTDRAAQIFSYILTEERKTYRFGMK